MSIFIDYSGEQFGHLRVLYRAASYPHNMIYMCACDCNQYAKIRVRGSDLLAGRVTHCGCLNARKPRTGAAMFDADASTRLEGSIGQDTNSPEAANHAA